MFIFTTEGFVAIETPTILANDRGFLLGDGIFTTLKVIEHNLIHFSAHYERLKSNAKTLKIPFAYSEEFLREACYQLIKLNKLNHDSKIIRITLTRGKSGRGIDIPATPSPNIVISIVPSSNSTAKALNLYLSSYKRNEYSPIIHIKALNYLEAIMARQEAKELAYDDALMCNTKSYICETTIANIFFTKDGMLYTPALQDGVLPGITREFIIKLAKKLGITIEQTSISPNMLKDFDGCFVTNCVAGIQEVTKINELTFNSNNTIRQICLDYNSDIRMSSITE